MQDLLNMIIGTSTTLDVFVIVRLLLVFMGLELFVIACALLGSMKRK